MNKTIGIFAHVDAGKTTFSECLLYHADAIKTMGRVDHKNSYMDTHNLEKQRGITIFSQQGEFDYNNNKYYLIDTPGHIDFSPEMERSIMVLDYAILIISGLDGVQSHTETVWELLAKHNIPTLIFVNKMDRDVANRDELFKDIKESISDSALSIDITTKEELSPEIIEGIAELDDELLEIYLDGQYDISIWTEKMRELLHTRRFFPVYYGSALKDIGIDNILEWLDYLGTGRVYDDKNLGAIVYKVRYDRDTRVTFLKLTGGSIKLREEIEYTVGDETLVEKVNEIRVYNGDKFIKKQEAIAGDVVGIVGLTKTFAGQGIGQEINTMGYDMIPTMQTRVVIDGSYSSKEINRVFGVLSDEEPTLSSSWNDELGELHINIMGEIQLEILKPIVKERFGIEIEFEKPSILYKETIGNSMFGYGHFEPLKHYAEVHLYVEPGLRGSGIRFINKCHADDLSVGNQNLIKHHIFEREHRGLLTGSSVSDIVVTLITGRAHNKHTSGGDFRQATYRALRQALEQADNILLEPYYDFRIKVESEYLGRVMSDVQRASGSFKPPITGISTAIIEGKVPVKTFMGYQIELMSYTKGKGSIALSFGGYDECHNTDEIIKEIGYDKNIDRIYSSSSIFCSKGQGYEVTWDKAKEAMHCPTDKSK